MGEATSKSLVFRVTSSKECTSAEAWMIASGQSDPAAAADQHGALGDRGVDLNEMEAGQETARDRSVSGRAPTSTSIQAMTLIAGSSYRAISSRAAGTP